MFPAFKVKLKGLDPKSKYMVMMDIIPVDQHRYKFHNSKWGLAGKADPEVQKGVHIHPDMAQDGETWMKKGASFSRVKVTNNMTNKNEFVSDFSTFFPRPLCFFCFYPFLGPAKLSSAM